MAVLGLRFCARAFSSCGKWGPLLITARRPLTITASLVAEHRLQTRRLSNCGSRAQSLRGMWDPPRPGLEPASPASAGRLPTTAPPGKPWSHVLCRAGWPRSSHQPEPAYTYILKWERHKLLVYLLNCIFRLLSYSSWLCILTYNTPKYKLRVIVFLSLKLLVHKTDVKTQYFKKWSAKQNQHLLFFSLRDLPSSLYT